ncbi:hypothetical protein EDB84DRAFT_766028 [Lactarius hengduanensis]|nr:hypothetical protein EDB84DRAFT_766028 [Lactarius hengduanensis]
MYALSHRRAGQCTHIVPALNPRKTQPFCDCQTSSSAKKSHVGASYVPTVPPSPPQESMTTLTEMTLSALAWLVAFAVRYGLSPAVPEMPSVRSGKAKVHMRQAEGKRIRSCSTRPVRAIRLSTYTLTDSQIGLVPHDNALGPEAPPRHDLNASFPPTPRCRTGMQTSPLRHSSSSPPPPCRTP